MQYRLTSIALPLPFRMGRVNSYLLRTGDRFVLIDTGAPNARDALARELESRGCSPGALGLVLLTHGDFDHTGNAASIRSRFGGRIAMHPADAAIVETGDMFANRRTSNPILRWLVPKLIGFGESERFAPDPLVEDGFSLGEFGIEAGVIWLPGHSRGSIGMLTSDGDFFCGDLFDNTKVPTLNSLMDDRDTAQRSAAKLGSLKIRTVYPGHGAPFTMDQLADGLR